MSATALAPPKPSPAKPLLHSITVEQYDRMVRAGVFDEDEPIELLDGALVRKMPIDPIHEFVLQRLRRLVDRLLPPTWDSRLQNTIRLPTSRSEPDVAVVRFVPSLYLTGAPEPADIGLLIEIANTSLANDRDMKGPLYARAGISAYWIVNTTDRAIEVYSQPAKGEYTDRRDYLVGESAPLMLDGQTVAHVAVSEVLP